MKKILRAILVPLFVFLIAFPAMSADNQTTIKGVVTITTPSLWAHFEPFDPPGESSVTLTDSQRKVDGLLVIADASVAPQKSVREWNETLWERFKKSSYFEGYTPTVVSNKESIISLNGVSVTLIQQELSINGNKRFVTSIFWSMENGGKNLYGHFKAYRKNEAVDLSPESSPMKDFLAGLKFLNK